MTLLVTGGAGFIASHLVDRLIEAGEDVRILDDMSNGRAANINPEAKLIVGDVADYATVSAAAKECSIIYHLASRRAVQQSLDHPLEVNEKNVAGTLTVLEVARHQQIPRVVSASSSSVYGRATRFPTPESAPAIPQSPYAASKLVGEHYARIYAELYGIETISLRYFNVYGPRQDASDRYAAVIPLFLEALTSGQRPIIYGDGSQSRAFTYVDDAVRATLAAGSVPSRRITGQAFNVASAATHTVNDILSTLGNILKIEASPIHAERRQGDIPLSCPDLALARRQLNWESVVDLDCGLARTVQAFAEDSALHGGDASIR